MAYKYSPVECYHCGSTIETYAEYVKKDFPLHTHKGIKMVERELHWNCAKELADNFEVENETKQELTDFDKCYQLFKDWLGLGDNTLSKHAVLRIKGLYLGKFYPKGQNTKGIYRGYDYETIYLTMLFVSDKAREALATVQFHDENHRINYLMTIIANNINFVNKQVEQNRRSVASTMNIELVEDAPEYVHQRREESKLSEAFQATENEDLLEDDLTDLFK